MADQSRRDEEGPSRREEIHARREDRRRQLRRRRLAAASALAFAVAAVITVAAVLIGGGSSGRDRNLSSPAQQKATSPVEGAAAPVRNATPQADWGPHAGAVPILEWHVLGAPDAAAPYPELYVSRPDFH